MADKIKVMEDNILDRIKTLNKLIGKDRYKLWDDDKVKEGLNGLCRPTPPNTR